MIGITKLKCAAGSLECEFANYVAYNFQFYKRRKKFFIVYGYKLFRLRLHCGTFSVASQYTGCKSRIEIVYLIFWFLTGGYESLPGGSVCEAL